jgi:acyl-CoA thioester hydrolase
VSAPAGPAAFRFHHEVDVRFRDVDAMGHAHHSLPLVYLEEARAAYWRDIAGRATVADIDYVMAEVTVRFHRRITYPDTLDVALRVSLLGGKSFEMVFEMRSGAGDLVVSGSTIQVMYDYAAGAAMPIPAELRARIEAYEGLTPAQPRPPR